MSTITLPQAVTTALARLEQAGFEAYAVGGCVRDSLRGVPPHDWDVATSASPDDMKRVFADCPLIETGIAHGTVTVLLDGTATEITTYRIDGPYSDGRHPDSVRFSSALSDDLSRRDFTVNAMAYHPQRGLVDPFGGRQDLENGILRAVGVAERRFEEDALRILRALRFAATLPLKIDPDTARAVLNCRALLARVSVERIAQELTRMLCGVKADTFLRDFSPVIFTVLPELEAMRGFEQRNRHHSYDVWEHTLHAIAASPPDPDVRWALLLHDSGKPFTFTLDENGEGHFIGHPKKSAALAQAILSRLHFSRERQERIVTLVRYHDLPIAPTRKEVRRRMAKLGKETLAQLLPVKEADRRACHPDYRESSLEELAQIRFLMQKICEENDCVDLHALAIDGNDLLRAGFPAGPSMGALLTRLLDAVVNEECENEKAALLRFAARSSSLSPEE